MSPAARGAHRRLPQVRDVPRGHVRPGRHHRAAAAIAGATRGRERQVRRLRRRLARRAARVPAPEAVERAVPRVGQGVGAHGGDVREQARRQRGQRPRVGPRQRRPAEDTGRTRRGRLARGDEGQGGPRRAPAVGAATHSGIRRARVRAVRERVPPRARGVSRGGAISLPSGTAAAAGTSHGGRSSEDGRVHVLKNRRRGGAARDGRGWDVGPVRHRPVGLARVQNRGRVRDHQSDLGGDVRVQPRNLDFRRDRGGRQPVFVRLRPGAERFPRILSRGPEG